MNNKELFSYYNGLFRSPVEIAGASLTNKKALRKSLDFNADRAFVEILNKLNIRLFISREYEHLLMCFHTEGEKLHLGYHPLPHPSGMAVKDDSLYAVSSRNPNFIVRFDTVKAFMERIEDPAGNNAGHLLPSIQKFYPGAFYFHDLAFIGNELYANSVGQNGIVKIQLEKGKPEELAWRPEMPEHDMRLLEKGNYLQLNSIAAGIDVESSFFSASAAKPQKLRPGHRNFPVDGRGVIFSGKGDIVAGGLTRPHSAKLHQDRLWVNNSGYGTMGYIEKGKLKVVKELPGWTRGLLLRDRYAFVGTSKILERFENYAPGLKNIKTETAVFIIDTLKEEICGKLEFPHGNQIFAIEAMDKNISEGFIFSNLKNNTRKIKSYFYKYKL